MTTLTYVLLLLVVVLAGGFAWLWRRLWMVEQQADALRAGLDIARNRLSKHITDAGQEAPVIVFTGQMSRAERWELMKAGSQLRAGRGEG